MELTINNTTLQVTNEGGTIIIKAERGEYRDDIWYEAPENEDEMPRMLHDAMAPIYCGTVAPTYKKWRDLWCSGDRKQDRKDFESNHKAAEAWKAVSDISADDIMNKLEEIYGDF